MIVGVCNNAMDITTYCTFTCNFSSGTKCIYLIYESKVVLQLKNIWVV